MSVTIAAATVLGGKVEPAWLDHFADNPGVVKAQKVKFAEENAAILEKLRGKSLQEMAAEMAVRGTEVKNNWSEFNAGGL